VGEQSPISISSLRQGCWFPKLRSQDDKFPFEPLCRDPQLEDGKWELKRLGITLGAAAVKRSSEKPSFKIESSFREILLLGNL